VLPFVMLGSSVQAMRTGDILPLVGALALIGVLVGGATWYRRRRQSPQRGLEENERQRQRQHEDVE